MPSRADAEASAQDRELSTREALAFAVIGASLAELNKQVEQASQRVRDTAAAGALAGVVVSAWWIRRTDAYKALDAVLRRCLLNTRRTVILQVSQLQDHALAYGIGAAIAIARESGSTTTEVPPAPTAAAATEAPGLDLRRLDRILARYNEETTERAKQTVIDAVLAQQRPEHTATQLAAVLDAPRWQGLRIARTEQYRAYREAQRETWLEDDDVTGWTWVAVLDAHTCGYCYAMHGTTHPLTEPMAAHPGCRCRMMPVTATTRGRIRGPHRFAELNDAEQNQILGPATAAAYRNGDFSLEDVVRVDEHPFWGRTGRTRSLRDLVGDEARTEYLKAL